jgi:hypothetical protein
MIIKPFSITFAIMGIMSLLSLSLVGSVSNPKYSFSPVEFQPINNWCPFENSLNILMVYGDYTACDHFYSGIHIPDGITVSRMTIHFGDFYEEGDMTVILWRTDLAGLGYQLASVDSYGFAHEILTASEDTSITIDNQSGSYYLEVIFPGYCPIEFYGVTLETTYPSFLSLVRK